MKKLILPLVFSALTPLAEVRAQAPAEDVTGTWIFETNVLGNRETVECTFRQKAADLSGSCKGEQFPEAAATGAVGGDGVRFSFTYLFAGQSFACTYLGKQTAGKEMTGSIVVAGLDGVSGEFKAKKQEQKN